jgi:hypothetical protein
VTRQPAAATQSIPVPEQRFTHLHMDLVGEGFRYLFTIIDRSTRWVEAIPVKYMEAATIADTLVAGWVSRFGVPAVITSDCGTQFTSAIWEELCKRLNIQHITTTAFHPLQQQDGREVPPPAERRAAGAVGGEQRARSSSMGPAGHEGGAKGEQHGFFGRDGAERPAGVAGPAAGHPVTAAVSAVLQGCAFGGANPPCPYEAPAASPFWAPGGSGGVHEHLHQERRQTSTLGAAVRGALRGPGARREGVSAAGGRQRGGGICGMPEAAHRGGAGAARGAAKTRSAIRASHIVHCCHLRTSVLREVLWRHCGLVYCDIIILVRYC